jgi:hypothetical protein
METAWMPKVAGILDIVAGALGLFFSLMMALWFAVFSIFFPMGSADFHDFHDFPMALMAIFMIPWAILMFTAGILAIVGGIYTLRRKKWGLALAGSVAAFFGSAPLGVAAIIFTVLSKNEFE